MTTMGQKKGCDPKVRNWKTYPGRGAKTYQCKHFGGQTLYFSMEIYRLGILLGGANPSKILRFEALTP